MDLMVYHLYVSLLYVHVITMVKEEGSVFKRDREDMKKEEGKKK